MGRSHRGSVFTVVREHLSLDGEYKFSAVIGVYLSLNRAEEVAAASKQTFKDMGETFDEYRFHVQVATYYDE